ncbi:Multicopper oxidase with three cupredoxin domains (includes cell division protein FtsP and spore coat protein CotA) [Lentzea aerocolonigenes]|nr:Multicopper oxidase with three cupredoxin domains (includes cell division protein FtsP and spore coat protein CotA) [Lentzea aerocolonigenes]
MAVRHVYLRIEEIAGYSPAEPSPHGAYRRDCMRNTGHEDGSIPLSEVNARRLDALVYREYLDPDYLIPKPDKLVLSDVNEPVFTHRVPGTVIYTRPGERLHVHVFNADTMPHSFHLHGLRYGIDSDGSWPMGTQSADGRRSDEICPGQHWTYRFYVPDDAVGAWPFHDHSRHIGESVNRGLFGGIVVLPEDVESPCDFELPPLVKEYVDRCCREHPDDEDDHGHIEAGHVVRPRHDGSHGGGGGGHGHGHGRNVRDHEHKGVLDFLEEWCQLEYAHPRHGEDDVLHVPVFLHLMSRGRGTPAFNSGPFSPAAAPFESVFGAEATFSYHCEIHQQMQGKVIVAAGEAAEVTVSIVDSDPMNMRFDPVEAKIRPGGKVRWTPGTALHTVTEDGAGIPSPCLNGRVFVGNTPTIVARAGQRIRWYVFNLDLGMNWHNFHPHAQRWEFAGEPVDVRSIGPAESFVVDTVAPPVLLLPHHIEEQHDHDGCKKYELCGDFLFHCHVEMHMMQGLAGLVRSKQTVWLTDEQADHLRETTGLPAGTCDNSCPDVDPDRCEQFLCGEWKTVPGSPEVCMMHATLVPGTTKVMFFGYGDTRDDLSRIWDYSTETLALPGNQPFDVTQPVHDRPLANIWSAEHTYLADGTILVHGGFTPRQTFVFDPATLSWSRKGPTAQDRFYSTTLTLADGRAITLFGSASKSFELYDPAAGTWSAPVVVPAAMNQDEYYPWAYVLPDGKIFIAGPHMPTQRFDLGAAGIANLESFATIAGNRSTAGEKGTSVLLPLRPPGYEPRVLIAGGDFASAQQTAEWIDLSSPTPVWQALPDLNATRAQQVNTVLLPDGRVLLAGGVDGADGGPAEIFDPREPERGWEQCATMGIPRGYHSAAILLPDGSVLMGGDRPGQWKSGESTQHERYFPSYFTLPRPVITAAPASVAHGAGFGVDTTNPAGIAEVVLLRPGAVTHGFNMSQRLIECEITGTTATQVQVTAPPNGNIAPPGPYLLFVVTAGRVPSEGRWISLT